MAARLRGARRSVSSLALATWEIAEQTPAVLNLAIGQPALSLLPMDAVQDGAARLSTYDARHILQYGAPAGSGHYLSALAGFLTAQLQRPPMLTRTMYVPGPRYGTHGAYARASLLTTVRTAYASQPRLCRIYRVPCTVYRGTTGARTTRRRSSPRPATPAGWHS